MLQRRLRKDGNPDLRRRQQSPTLELPSLEEELVKYLSPSLFTPLKYCPGNHEKLMRDRLYRERENQSQQIWEAIPLS